MPKKYLCNHCYYDEFHPSRRRTSDWLRNLFGYRACRCINCGKRHFIHRFRMGRVQLSRGGHSPVSDLLKIQPETHVAGPNQKTTFVVNAVKKEHSDPV